jgi:hypothetical protein
MSFMGLGFTLEQVVAMATINPAKVINRAPKIGTLQMGAPGDVAIMELVEGPVSFVDTRNNKRDGGIPSADDPTPTSWRQRWFSADGHYWGMPALGQKQTFRIAIAMSALSPSQTFVGVSGMSA